MKKTEGAYERAYKDLKHYVLRNTVKFELQGQAKRDLLDELEIIESNLQDAREQNPLDSIETVTLPTGVGNPLPWGRPV